MTDKEKIKRVCADLGLEYPRDYFTMYSDVHQRWEFHHLPRKVLYGATTRAIIRAIRRCYAGVAA